MQLVGSIEMNVPALVVAPGHTSTFEGSGDGLAVETGAIRQLLDGFARLVAGY